MKELAAYLLLVVSGNATPSAEDVKGVLSAVGIEGSDEELARLTASLEGKDLDTIVEEGRKKLVNVGGGGGGAAPAASGAGGAAAPVAAAKKEEEKKEEEEEAGGAGGLFGDDDDW